MRLEHRTFHRRAWHVLSIVVTLGVILALWLRPPPDQPEPMQPAASEAR
jgi:hypothetical protein